MSLLSVTKVTSSTNLDQSQTTFLIDATSGNITFTLDNDPTDGENYGIKRIDNSSHTVTVKGFNNSQTIDGSINVNLNYLDTMTLVAFNNRWYKVNQ